MVYTTWPGGVGAFVPFPPLAGAGKKSRRNRRKSRKNRKANRKTRRTNRK